MAVMTNTEFVKKLKDAATNFKTLYVMGCFGAPMNAANKTRYTANHSYNKQAARTAMIRAASEDTFGFDCVCLIKGILWGWCGNTSKTYGGAGYAVNGVPDIGADSMITKCSDISTDFTNLVPGEAVWMKGHIGVYVGDGLAVECTPKWENKVQITACNCSKSGYNRRNWTKHGKLPYIEYVGSTVVEDEDTPPVVKTTSVAVGDIVTFTGTSHYSSSNSTKAVPCKPGKAKITNKYNGKHPYHLVRVSGGTSNVYGWVDEKDIWELSSSEKAIAVGATVTITGTKYATGQTIPAWVKKKTHIVSRIDGKRALLGENGGICSWVNLTDIKAV